MNKKIYCACLFLFQISGTTNTKIQTTIPNQKLDSRLVTACYCFQVIEMVTPFFIQVRYQLYLKENYQYTINRSDFILPVALLLINFFILMNSSIEKIVDFSNYMWIIRDVVFFGGDIVRSIMLRNKLYKMLDQVANIFEPKQLAKEKEQFNNMMLQDITLHFLILTMNLYLKYRIYEKIKKNNHNLYLYTMESL